LVYPRAPGNGVLSPLAGKSRKQFVKPRVSVNRWRVLLHQATGVRGWPVICCADREPACEAWPSAGHVMRGVRDAAGSITHATERFTLKKVVSLSHQDSSRDCINSEAFRAVLRIPADKFDAGFLRGAAAARKRRPQAWWRSQKSSLHALMDHLLVDAAPGDRWIRRNSRSVSRNSLHTLKTLMRSVA